MSIIIRGFTPQDASDAARIWNQVIEGGVAFPQLQMLDEAQAEAFFSSQTFTGLARDESGRVLGLYILHPNNVGRCGHIANCSYAVERSARGQGIGETLVRHSLKKAKETGYRLMQFNAVVAENYPALHLYEKVGFRRLGTVPGGFRTDKGYVDIVLFYHTLDGLDA